MWGGSFGTYFVNFKAFGNLFSPSSLWEISDQHSNDLKVALTFYNELSLSRKISSTRTILFYNQLTTTNVQVQHSIKLITAFDMRNKI